MGKCDVKSIIKKYPIVYRVCHVVNVWQRKMRIKYFYMRTLKMDFQSRLGYQLDLEDPQTFNAKLQWLKCYYRDPNMQQCADKVAVRDIIAEEIGQEYLIPIYGVYDNVRDINLDELPKEFVLKTNHSSGQVIICIDKEQRDWKKDFCMINDWLSVNYYYESGEWVYKDIKPKILVEKLLKGEIVDYKFLCFHGEPKMMFTCSEREQDLKVTFFDMQFNKLPFIRMHESSDTIIKPVNFEKMIDLSRRLARSFPFVRVDFYENEGKIYFGELTFFPGNGMEWFEPLEWDYKLGALIDLSSLRKVAAQKSTEVDKG